MKLLLICILLSTSLVAMSNEGRFIEIDIDKMNFVQPIEGQRDAGILNFKSVNFSWDGMQIDLRNNEQIFDAQISYRPTYISFLSNYLNIGLRLDEDNIFSAIESLSIFDSKFIINPQFFSFNGDGFEYVDMATKTRLQLKKFNLFCSGTEDYDLTTAEGIIAGCMTSSFVSGKDETQLANAEIEYRNESEQSPVYLKSKIDQIELLDNVFTAKTQDNFLQIEPFELKTGNLLISCKKDPDLIVIDQEKITQDCLNSLSIDQSYFSLLNKDEKINFDVNINKFSIENNDFSMSIPQARIMDANAHTVLNQIELSCFKATQTPLNDLQKVLGDCFKKSEVKISSIDSEKLKKSKTLLNYEEFYSEEFKKGIRSSDKNSNLKDIKITSENNYLRLKTKVNLIFNFKIQIEGKVTHYPEEEKINIYVTKTKLPLGIRFRKVLMFLLKHFLVVDFIEYKGNNIIIQL